MGYLHITIIDRLKIEAYLEAGFNLSYIATKLGFHRSSISREIKRCPINILPKKHKGNMRNYLDLREGNLPVLHR